MPVENEIVHIKDDIRRITEAAIQHNKDDNGHFTNIGGKLDANHDIHVRNEVLLTQILAQATKTNGRVTKLEDLVAKYDTTIALLQKSVETLTNLNETQVETSSKLNGMMIANWDRLEKEYVSKERFSLVEKGFYTVAGLIILAVIGALVALVVKDGAKIL
jgi:cell division protein FtsL